MKKLMVPVITFALASITIGYAATEEQPITKGDASPAQTSVNDISKESLPNDPATNSALEMDRKSDDAANKGETNEDTREERRQ